jgi:Cu2+-exporting ATPase
MKFKVKGITCAGCATDIETVLRNSDGVVNASVNYSTCEISVEYDYDEINEERIMNIFKRLGLRAYVVA